MRKVLIISYYYPPAGGPGVQRLLKFSKYLPENGWEPIILTVKKGNYPAIDTSLLQEIPENQQVIRTANFEPDMLYQRFTGARQGSIPVAVLAQKDLSWKQKLAHWIRLNLFVPDAKIGWISPAYKAAEKLIKTQKIDLIYSSSPPPTVHLIARKLHKKYQIPWVCDFRDPWTNIHYYRNAQRFKIVEQFDKMLEKRVLCECDAVTTASELFQDLLPIPGSKKRLTITNGYDDEVYSQAEIESDEFCLVHSGGITANRFYDEFFAGFREFLQDKEKSSHTRLILVGNVNAEIVSRIRDYISADNLKITGYLPHEEAISHMRSAAVNLVFLEKIVDYKGHIPGKIFEYIALQRPVLGAGAPQGDTGNIIRKSGCGDIYPAASNWKGILDTAYNNWQQGNKPLVDYEYIKQFHRRNLTRKLADYFTEVL